MSAWGQKATISVYFEGTDPKSIEWLLGSIENLMLPPETDFVGMKVEEVQDKPLDQGAAGGRGDERR